MTNIEMVNIDPGSFTLSHGNEIVRIQVTRRFAISKYVITQGQWRDIVSAQPWINPRVESNSVISQKDYDAIIAKKMMYDDNCPAVFISWNDAITFRKQLTLRSGMAYALPTEGQWELACRAGSAHAFPWGDDQQDYDLASKYAWYRMPRSKLRNEPKLERVGQRLPNRFGLHDMCGLVKEWVLDRFNPTDSFDVPESVYSSSMIDPLGREGTHAMARNGSFDSPLQMLAASWQSLHTPDNKQCDIGFRVVVNAA